MVYVNVNYQQFLDFLIFIFLTVFFYFFKIIFHFLILLYRLLLMKIICDWENCNKIGSYKAPIEKDNSKNSDYYV